MALTRDDIDKMLESGAYPIPEGGFMQDKSGLVIHTKKFEHPYVPEGKLKNRLKYNPINQIIRHRYEESMPATFEKLCYIKPAHYPKFKPEPFMQMMKEYDSLKISGYQVLIANDEDASIIPILRGNKNAMTLGFFWNNSHVAHKKLCIGIKAQYYLIRYLPNIGIEQLFLRGGSMQYKTIFDPELRTYG